MFNKNILGTRLRELRTSRKMTMQNVADGIDSLSTTIGNIERGQKPASLDMVIALAEFFNVSLDYLLGGTDLPRPIEDRDGKKAKASNERSEESGSEYLPKTEALKQYIKSDIACYGKQAYYGALKKIMEEQDMVIPFDLLAARLEEKKDVDPELNDMLVFLSDLWKTGDENLKTWAKVQFTRAFPQDVHDEVEKKLQAMENAT